MHFRAVGAAFLIGCAFGWLARPQPASRRVPRPALPVLAAPSDTPAKHLRLFILAGQSNMSGRGKPPPLPIPTGVWIFGNDYRWHVASEPVDSPTAQVDVVSLDPWAGFSPALPFCRELREQGFSAPLGLIPCAMGYSSLQEWRQDLRDSSLYGSLVKRARAASTQGELSGILWYQGETDAKASAPGQILLHETWGQEFVRFVKNLRRDLNKPALPVIYASLGETNYSAMFPYWRSIQAQQDGLRLPHGACARMRDLPLRDGLHLDSDGMEEAGRRFAWAWLATARNGN
jgi:hypothetical protein